MIKKWLVGCWVAAATRTSTEELDGFFFDYPDTLVTETPAVKLRLTSKGKKASAGLAVVREGSAWGDVPSAVAADAQPDLPILDIAVGREISLEGGLGKVRIEKLIYDEAVESKLYLASHNGQKVIVKVFMPKRRGDFSELQQEITALRELEGLDQVVRLVYADDRIFKTSKNKQIRFCILELLHVSLAEFMDSVHPGGLPVSLIHKIAVEGITALEAVHSREYVHGDVGIGNLMFASETLEKIKLIDFGYARKYILDGVHVEPGHNPLPVSSRSLLSISELEGHFPSRRDDMFRLGEILLKLLNTDYSRLFKTSKVEDIVRIKSTTVPSVCCSGATHAFDMFFERVRALEYAETPDYEALRNLFR